MTGTASPYDAPLSALRNRVGDVATWLAIWEARSEPDAHPRRCANDAADAIDAVLRQLYLVRARLTREIRESGDASAARVMSCWYGSGVISDDRRHHLGQSGDRRVWIARGGRRSVVDRECPPMLAASGPHVARPLDANYRHGPGHGQTMHPNACADVSTGRPQRAWVAIPRCCTDLGRSAGTTSSFP